jgi:hypothetical protein
VANFFNKYDKKNTTKLKILKFRIYKIKIKLSINKQNIEDSFAFINYVYIIM